MFRILNLVAALIISVFAFIVYLSEAPLPPHSIEALLMALLAQNLYSKAEKSL